MLGVVGDLVEDIVVWLREPIQAATDTDAAIFRRRGGSAANVAAFAGPRYPTRFIGCVGPDAVGNALVAELGSHGVDVRVQRSGVTGTVVALIDESGERSMIPDRGAATLLTEVDPTWLEDIDHLHAPAYSLVGEPIASTTVKLIGRIRSHGATVSIDASSTGIMKRYGRERFLDLLTALGPDLLFPNREEAEFLRITSGGGPGPALARLRHTTVVVKNAQHPTLVLAPDAAAFEVPVPAVVDVRDTTGAGDAFAAGFLTDYLNRHDLRAACEAGHSLAARILQTPGASIFAPPPSP